MKEITVKIRELIAKLPLDKVSHCFVTYALCDIIAIITSNLTIGMTLAFALGIVKEFTIDSEVDPADIIADACGLVLSALFHV